MKGNSLKAKVALRNEQQWFLFAELPVAAPHLGTDGFVSTSKENWQK